MNDTQFKLNQLRQYQGLPLNAKITLSKKRIREWLDAFDDQCYVAFSGGKDSTVLLDLVWSIDPTIPAVFVDTGLEYPEIREFVKSYGERVVWLRPKMRFDQVIEKYGYPVLSKKISMGVDRYRNTKSVVQKTLRLHGGINPSSGKKQNRTIPVKYHNIVQAPFSISEKCCDVMKKAPMKKYGKAENRKAFIGTMAGESQQREMEYLKTGCNAFEAGTPASRPMSFWTEQDVLEYSTRKNVPICSVYGDVLRDFGGSLYTTEEQRTGCMFCMFGVHLEKGENRFQRMARTHPRMFDYCMRSREENGLGCGEVLDFIGVPYSPYACEMQTDMFDAAKEYDVKEGER